MSVRPSSARPRRRLAAVAAGLTALLALTACGNSEEPKAASPLDGITVTGGNETTAPTVALKTKPLASAEGKAVNPSADLPAVKVQSGKPATITIPKGKKAPSKTFGANLIEGSGAKVEAGQTIRVTYTGALWKDGKVFDSSASSPQGYFETVIGKQQVIKAWDAQLVGKAVGSRVLMVVPPADGYGAAGSPPKISGTDTLVFVVDILAAY